MLYPLNNTLRICVKRRQKSASLLLLPKPLHDEPTRCNELAKLQKKKLNHSTISYLQDNNTLMIKVQANSFCK